MTIQAGELWVANIPFTDGSGSKRRPLLVLWLDAMDVVAVVTTALPRWNTDVPLADWQASGLRAASTVRLARLDCLEQSLLIHRIGTIPDGCRCGKASVEQRGQAGLLNAHFPGVIAWDRTRP